MTIQGFPILTQVTWGRLDQADTAAEDITADETRPPTIITLDVTMDGLTAPADAQAARAHEATATALVSYQE